MLRRIRAFVNRGDWYQTDCGSSEEDLVGVKKLVGSHWHFGRFDTKHAGEIEHAASGNARQQAVSGPGRDEAPISYQEHVRDRRLGNQPRVRIELKRIVVTLL